MTHAIARALAAAAVAASLVLPAGARQATTADRAALMAVVADYMADRAGAAGLGAVSLDRMADLSLDRARRQAAAASALDRRLSAVAPDRLTHDDWITYADLDYELRLTADAGTDYWMEIPVTPYSSPLRGLTTPFSTAALRTPADLDAYLDALGQMPVIMTACEAKLRGQLDRGIVLPAAEIALAAPFVRTFLGDPPHSPFSVAPARLTAFAPEAQAAFQQKVDTLIREAVNPSIVRLAAFIDGPYRAHAATDVGLAQYPGGRDYYQHLIRRHVGLDLTPEAIHQIGLAEVERLNRELDGVRQEAGFTGTLAEFRAFLKTDPRFFAKSSDQIGDTMMAAIRRIEPRVDQFFATKPKAPYGVLRLDEALEQSMTYGYYQIPTVTEPTGYYRFNGSQPESRSLLMVAAIIYHELIPGHHYQLTRWMENPALSPFRRSQGHTAFIEGWGEYASDLAGEMGMYDDPYRHAGRLAMDLFVSTRLVVDTGMNALGWSRERAMQYMHDNTLESDVQIGTETLRYSSDMPGQALAYKLGARAIRQLRDEVKQAQGDRFDIRRFHDHLLDYGSMPLEVLKQHVACFLSERHAKSGTIEPW